MNKTHILLVEDEAPKCTHIEAFLKGIAPHVVIDIARSYISALDMLESLLPDLLLLDMSLPTFDVGGRESGGRPQGFGGIEILRYMTLAEISCPTIVITGYEAFVREAGKPVDLSQMRRDLQDEFPGLLRGVLHYNSTYGEWRDQLKQILSECSIPLGGDK